MPGSSSATGGTVRVVAAPRENMKITTPGDLHVAELALRERGARLARPPLTAVGASRDN